MGEGINNIDRGDKTVVVPQSDKTVVVPQSDKTVVVPQSDKTVVVPQSDKTVVVPQSDKTVVVPQSDKTVVAGRTVAYQREQSDEQNTPDDDMVRTMRPEMPQQSGDTEIDQSREHFILKGEPYYLVRTLSENSGEAQIFLVTHDGKEQVLKIYYPNYDVNRKLMQLIHNFQFEMIVRLDDYGKTYVDGKQRFYELMEYLKGGTLQECSINGDMNRFRRIALQAAAALAYCHQNNILHKDIKPSNYFFRDEADTQLVLGDFGISSIIEEGKALRTTQARTPIYAAPEMYADVIDGEVELTPAADYYSLGMTLFALWLGENPMSSNERVMMRQKNEGRLPRMDELPPRVKQLIQGLTVVNPMSRWKYEEVERWFLGEDVPIDTSSPFLRYKSFIVDPDRNLVADNIHELVPLLLQNESLAVNYLYNGRITSWLEACGNMKLSALVKDIIKNRYPADPKAGLMASVYVMEPSYPYYDVQHEKCEDVHSIALSLLSYKERYALDLQNPDDALYLWLEAHTKVNVDQLRSYFTPDAEPHVAVMRMVYEIDPDIPFLSKRTSSTVEEIVSSFGSGNMTEDDWHSLVDGRLLAWMNSHEDIIACEALRILTQGQPYSKTLAYKVLYNMDRSAAYDLCDAHTPEQVGGILSDRMQQLQHMSEEDLKVEMQDFLDPEGRFAYYAQLQGWYQQLADAKACFDLQSEENRNRLSAYDLHTALYRFCRILGATPVYLLPNGQEVTDVSMLEELKGQENQIRGELRNGSLSQWMAVFYHEDPACDFAEEYSYERTLEQWLMAMGKLDAQQKYYKRFMKAQDDTAARIADVRREWNTAHYQEMLWRYLFYGLVAVWIGFLLFFGIDDKAYLVEHPYLSIVAPLGGITGLILAVRLFFNGYGPIIAFLLGALGGCTAMLPMWLLKFVYSWHSSLFTPTIIVITVLYVLLCHYTDYRRENKYNAKMIREILGANDISTALLEPLYYTFKTKSYRYKSTKFGLLDDISNQTRSLSGENIIHYVLWALLVSVFVAEFCVFSSHMMNKRPPMIEKEQVKQMVMDNN